MALFGRKPGTVAEVRVLVHCGEKDPAYKVYWEPIPEEFEVTPGSSFTFTMVGEPDGKQDPHVTIVPGPDGVTVWAERGMAQARVHDGDGRLLWDEDPHANVWVPALKRWSRDGVVN